MAFSSTALVVIVVWSVIGVWMFVLAIACLCCTKEQRTELKKRVSYLRPVSAHSKDNSYLQSPVPLGESQLTTLPQTVVSGTESNLTFNIIDVFEKTLKKTASSYCVDMNRLVVGNIIGQGQFGVVYQGKLLDKSLGKPMDVAIKTVQGERCNEADVSAFLGEVLRMKGFGHRNVLSMIALVLKDNRPFVVLPHMARGDVKTYIADYTQTFTVKDLLEIGSQISDGMSYLTEQSFVHRDLAARNCMIDSDGTVKIADFGLSRDLFNADYYKMVDLSQPLPIKWMAVESLQSRVFTHQSDVWAFGVVLWELLTRGCNPYRGMDNPTAVQYVLAGHRLQQPAAAPDEIYGIMKRCWLSAPSERPTFGKLSVELHDILDGGEHRKKAKRTKSSRKKVEYYNTAVSLA